MHGIYQPDSRNPSSSNSPKVSDHSQLQDGIFKNLPVAIYTCDQEGFVTSYNQAAVKLWGKEPVIGQDLWFCSWKIFKPTGDPLPLDQCPMARTLKEERPIEDEEILVERPDGSRLHIKPHPSPIFDEKGKLIGGINTLIDITESKQAEEKSAKLAAIVESSEDAIISKSLDGHITSWNRAAEEIFGYTEKEVVGEHITILIPKDRHKEEKTILSKIKNGEKVAHYETIRTSKDGRKIHVSLSISPIKDKNGKVIGASKIARNISKQKEGEVKLQRYADNLAILNLLGKVVSESLDLEEILQKATDATTQLTGADIGAFFYNKQDEKGESLMLYTLSGAAKTTFEKHGVPSHPAAFHSTFSRRILRVDDITQDENYSKNKPYYGIPAGRLKVKSFLSVPVISKNGLVLGGLVFGHSEPAKFATDHETLVAGVAAHASIALDNAKLYEEIKVLNSKKDEFIGLASHELKTPLTSITAYLQVLARSQTDGKNKNFISKSINQVNKLSALVSDLLDVSKIEAGKLHFSQELFDIRTLIDEAVELIEHAYPSHKITLKTTVNQLFIKGDPQRIEQVVINLLTNSIKYSPAEKEVEVSLTYLDQEVKVGVKDFGIGLQPDKLDDIFSRFFRVDGLSPHMSGLGIGLYLSKEIIERHQGTIWAESEAGKGSTFWFIIPVTVDAKND